MTPTELTAVGGFVLSVVALIVLPLVFRRQARKQTEEQERRETIRADAMRDAAETAGDVVSWEKINQALAISAREERAAHQERLAELRASFLAEAERMKRLTDHDLDRANAEIARLASQIRSLEDRIRKADGDQ